MADGEPADRHERGAAPGAARARRPQGLAGRRRAAALLAAGAFLLYRATLLPGLDFGDTASFQSGITSLVVTSRDGYPLYFAIGRLLLALTHGTPAHTANLASAIEGAIACGLFVLVAVELSGSVLAGAAAAALFAGSYTFWSQAVIAEVYALHAALTLLALYMLLRWARTPTPARLGCFFAVYALGFGNHLSMILLLPGFALFLFASAPSGWRSMLTPRVIALALACALAGALQYAPNMRTLWMLPHPPHGAIEALQRFWFDVTKEDWRETLVMHVPRSMLSDRVAMYAFDLDQQFGWVGIALAGAGMIVLAATAWRRALLMAALYLANLGFAFGYNVGDTHVFYIPSHLALALLTAPGIAAAGSILHARSVLPCLLALYAGTRVYHAYPAMDRSRDDRPRETLAALTKGLDDSHDVLITTLDWQVQNGLAYFTQHDRPGVTSLFAADVLHYLPTLEADNHAIGRQLVADDRSTRLITSRYGPAVTASADARSTPAPLAATVQRLPIGTRYVFCLLKPGRDFSLDWTEIGLLLMASGEGRPVRVPDGDYVVIAGVRGQAPTTVIGENRPFSTRVDVGGVDTELRMDGWLNMDTIRRMGYGHVIVNRQHTLIIERGISFAAFDAAGTPLTTGYLANLFAPQTRYLIRGAAPSSQ